MHARLFGADVSESPRVKLFAVVKVGSRDAILKTPLGSSLLRSAFECQCSAGVVNVQVAH